jgi:hypothetical protein
MGPVVRERGSAREATGALVQARPGPARPLEQRARFPHPWARPPAPAPVIPASFCRDERSSRPHGSTAPVQEPGPEPAQRPGRTPVLGTGGIEESPKRTLATVASRSRGWSTRAEHGRNTFPGGGWRGLPGGGAPCWPGCPVPCTRAAKHSP